MDVAYTVWTWHLDPFNSFQKSEDPAQQRVEFEGAPRDPVFRIYGSGGYEYDRFRVWRLPRCTGSAAG